MRRFPVDFVPREHECFELPPKLRHHLRVVRIGQGERLELLDPQGTIWQAGLRREGRRWFAQIDGAHEPASNTFSYEVPALLLAKCKPEAMARALRMAVELGANALYLVRAERSAPGTDGGKFTERLERVIAEAARQCLRMDTPTLKVLGNLDEALPLWPIGAVADPQAPLDQPVDPALVMPVLAIGPEAGWTASELQKMTASGWRSIRLPGHVLRVETAAAVGLALLSRKR